MKRFRSREAAALAVLLLAAAALRWPCLRGDLWLDEVWSVDLARGAKSLYGVVFGIRHDNSNPLNSLWLYLVADARDFAVFRLFSYACGLLCVAVLAVDPEDPPAGLLAGALAATSAAMVLYSTEARGYAPMALFAVLCRRLLPPPGPLKPARAAAFVGCAVLGFLSHSTFVFVFAGLGAWALARYPRREWRSKLAALFVPVVALLAVHAVLRGGLEVGGAAVFPFLLVAARTMILWSGASGNGATAVLGMAALVYLPLREIQRLRLRRDPEFWFHAVLLSSAVAFSLAFPFRAERHYFAVLPFVLILAARGLLRMLRAAPFAKAAAVLLIAGFVLGNGLRIRALATEGRGHYLDALKRMAAETPGDVVTVGSDHKTRNTMLLEFYAPYLVPPKRVDHVTRDRMTETPPDWYLRHEIDSDLRYEPPELFFSSTTAYRFVQSYPYAGMSGWIWLLYRREPPRPPSI